MKLYKILFEQEEQLKLLSPEEMKAPESAFKHISVVGTVKEYRPPAFAMIDWWNDREQGFALFHVGHFRKWAAEGMLPFESWICAYAGSNERHSRDCGGAVEVSYMVRSPQFPGAGAAMYALISDYYKAPITSDRQSSTSNSAKKAWAKIESSSDWTKVELDNYGDNYGASGPYGHHSGHKKYFDIKGLWPNRLVSPTTEPKTPNNKQDDCVLPDSIPSLINKKLGSANAWIYNGPLNAEELLSHGQEVLIAIANESGLERYQLEQEIKNKSNNLFTKYYKGIEG
jgi:hypothetical protein